MDKTVQLGFWGLITGIGAAWATDSIEHYVLLLVAVLGGHRFLQHWDNHDG